MATVESAMWGTFRGCIPADHLDEVGQIRHDAPDAVTGFDHVQFYRDLAHDLAQRGF
jgi:triacylglycerol lipase